MIHTEDQIRSMALTMMQDLEKDYFFEDKIHIAYEENLEPLWGDKIPKGWIVVLPIPDQQFPNNPLDDAITITINDNTGDVLNYIEGPGRPVPCTLKINEEGKYYIYPLYDFISAVE